MLQVAVNTLLPLLLCPELVPDSRLTCGADATRASRIRGKRILILRSGAFLLMIDHV